MHVEETLSHASLFVLGVCKAQQFEHEVDRSEEAGWGKEGEGGGISPVSYTHLTLPTMPDV